MKKSSIHVNLGNELKARHIALLVQEASKYESSIYIQIGARIYLESTGKKVNAKSIMGMMTLGLDIGEELEVTADGDDEEAAVDGIERFMNGRLA